MGIFWKKPKNKTLNGRQEAFANKVAAVLIRRQTRMAAYLNRRTQYWNRSSKIMALILFSLLFGGISLYLLLKAIY